MYEIESLPPDIEQYQMHTFYCVVCRSKIDLLDALLCRWSRSSKQLSSLSLSLFTPKMLQYISRELGSIVASHVIGQILSYL